MKAKILILSAGRRVELVQSFVEALNLLSLENDYEVIAADANPTLSSACRILDSNFTLPRVDEEIWGPALIELCKAESVSIVIPTIDTELRKLADLAEELRKMGVTPIISASTLINACRDKRLTGILFEQMGVRYPEIYHKDKIKFPTFCKPYDGSSSIGAKSVFSADELTYELLENPKNIFMELIPNSFVEVTVDGYFDRNGDLKALVPRERIEIRAGEVSKGITRKGKIYARLISSFSKLKDARGCITFQVFWNKSTDEVVGLEINPRFGGGYPLTDAAGCKFAEWIIREYILGEVIERFDDWKENLLMLRYDAKVLVQQ